MVKKGNGMSKFKFVEQFVEELTNTITERVVEKIQNEVIENLEEKILEKIIKDLTNLNMKKEEPKKEVIDSITSDEWLFLIQPINSLTMRLDKTVRARLHNILMKENIHYIWQLVTKEERVIWRIPSAGRISIRKLKEVLKSFGLSFGTKLTKEQREFCEKNTINKFEDEI